MIDFFWFVNQLVNFSRNWFIAPIFLKLKIPVLKNKSFKDSSQFDLFLMDIKMSDGRDQVRFSGVDVLQETVRFSPYGSPVPYVR
jgi:hypothetical protein